MPSRRHHPYLSGNFAPIDVTLPLTPCSYHGSIPSDLAGGEYVRNGGNPVTNADLGRDAHWFDGDGMLSGVLFRRRTVGEESSSSSSSNKIITSEIEPLFVNQYLLTDVYYYARRNSWLRKPVLPSIATLVSPVSGVLVVLLAVVRTVVLAVLSRVGRDRYPIKKISVANTSVLYHDGRALATCESGPPLRFALPGLETVGWFNGHKADGEPSALENNKQGGGFGGDGALSWMKEWTTAHPRVDPITKELIAFHSTFAKPYVRYSIVKPSESLTLGSSIFDQPVPGINSPKMMHDFGVSQRHTVIMDLPLTLDPMNQARGMPSLCYDSTKASRFGVFPRYDPASVRWFETNPCLVFHTANCWDNCVSKSMHDGAAVLSVNLLACRLTSASMVFRAGNLATPEYKPTPPEYVEEEQCRLYYYSFPLSADRERPSHIQHEWALSAIPFEFPTVAPGQEMQEARYVYGCSTSESFTVALGKAAKIDYLVKVDVATLIARGLDDAPQPVRGCVDDRTLGEVAGSKDRHDPIKLFTMPPGWFAQEPRFVARSGAKDEDDGWLLTYVFDEAQLDERGTCGEDARSELWVIDAKTMRDVVARIKLPQRVPYGLHGNWFSEGDIQQQKPVERVRQVEQGAPERSVAMWVRDVVERIMG